MDWRLQRHPIARIIVVALLGFLALAAWALSSPAGSSPDDDFHLTSIWCAQGERPGLCENITSKSVDVPNDVVHAPCFAYHKEISGACQESLGKDMFSMGRANELEHSYPGGFYWVMSWFAGTNVYLSVIVMRLFNSLLFVLTCVLAYLLIDKSGKRALKLALLVTVIPLACFIIPSNNPSSWVLFTPGLVFLTARSLLNWKYEKKFPILLSATLLFLTILASAARADGAIFSAFAALLAVISTWGKSTNRLMVLIVAALVVPVAVIGVVSGGQANSAVNGLSGNAVHGFQYFTLLFRNIADLPSLYAGIFGTTGLGWLDTPMPGIVWVTGISMVCIFIYYFLQKPYVNSKIALWIGLTALIVVPLAMSQNSAAVIGAFVQPRYVFPIFALFVIMLFITNETINSPLSEYPRVLSGLLIISFSVSLSVNALRYSVGLDTGIGEILKMAPLQAFVLILSISLGLLSVLALAAMSITSKSNATSSNSRS